jgi:hypothetical protein
MDDILRNFITENTGLLKNAPLDFFENYKNKATGNQNGIHIAWIMGWGAEQNKLATEIQKNFPLDALQRGEAEVVIVYCLAATNGSLTANCFDSSVIDFIQRYYQPGWVHNYLSDIEQLMPSLSDFGDLVHSPNIYKNITSLINRRYRKFSEGI